VQWPSNKISAAVDYLYVNRPFEGKNNNFEPLSFSRERYKLQLYVETVLM
jgi:hypothetical protein